MTDGSIATCSISTWSVEDVLDFECALAADNGVTEETIRTRDRRYYEEKIKPALSDKMLVQRRIVFRAWLDARRTQLAGDLPGEQFLHGWYTVLAVAVITGLLLGGAVASPPLLYRGGEPVNVVDFLTCTLVVQWMLIFGALLVWLLRRLSLLPARWHPIQTLTKSLITIVGQALHRLPGEQRLKLRAILGRLEQQRQIYGSLIVWPLLACTQLFAVCFNVGILLVLLWNPLGHEKRFGWQTHYDLIRRHAPDIVSGLEAPWSWLPDTRLTPEQVSATNYSPGDSADKLPADAARAWWPFLFFSIALYGLAFRAALLAFVCLKLRLALQALPFDHADANALWRRLTGPLIKPSSQLRTTHRVMTTTLPAFDPHAGSSFALVANELTLTENDLRSQLEKFFRWQLAGMLPVQIDHLSACASQLNLVRESAPSLAGVVLAVPAERDPIVAITLFVEEVVRAANGKCEVVVLLVPRKDGEIFSAVDSTRTILWREKAASEGLRIGMESWRNG